ncbi:hypothetical protein NBRC110019_05260 [Neptunitalea chrysea]|uniref:SnoaL-like domain-containing protein n=1 Tax=Neptunitalea chrysea TaxID=1647581 RepID=A0A9W6EUL5_9FLAO|nr:nuclear transport factor 2 family protein [Neptunitalea chrysea]GLB51487.1 hypothetical protein NBRC110019_05260 [Neptunitalea chrysea]
MKKLVYILLLISLSTYSQTEKESVNLILNTWHKAASEANFETYFNLMSEESVFIGTDATENWNKKEFMDYSKPYFDKGKAWNFTAFERNIYFNKEKNMAWFDELLDTQMKICRGSGVLIKENGNWKIKHYVLSMTIPNSNVGEVIKIKTPEEDKILNKK